MPGRTAYLRRARHWLANRGLRGFLRELWYRAQLLLQGKPVPGQENNNLAQHPFDVTYGTDTGGLFWGESLEAQESQRSAYWATGYYGISPSAFSAALDLLALDWQHYTFVDVGCGKGRAMLLALQLPFRKVLGVELSPQLAAIAQSNLDHFRPGWRRPNVPAEALQGDATEFTFPEGPLLLFLYHPFAAPVMKRFLEKVADAARQRAAEVFMLYANPELSRLVASTPGAEWLWQHTFPLTPEEGAADRFGSHGESFAAFRFSAPHAR